MIEHNGKTYARVTEVLKHLNDFSKVSEAYLQEKAAIGTQVHTAIYDDLQGEFPFVEEKAIGYYNSFQKWRDRLKPTFVEKEVRFYNDEKRLTGCADAIAHVGEGDFPIILDYKTSASESPTWILQAHLYHFLAISHGMKISNRSLFLKLDKLGRYPQVFDYKITWNTSNHCLRLVDEYWKKQEQL